MAPESRPPGQPVWDAEWAAENNLPRILAISAVAHIVTAVFVFLRLYARFFVLRKPAKDDIFIMGAYVSSLRDRLLVLSSTADIGSLVP
jgi:hypothetical protein